MTKRILKEVILFVMESIRSRGPFLVSLSVLCYQMFQDILNRIRITGVELKIVRKSVSGDFGLTTGTIISFGGL